MRVEPNCTFCLDHSNVYRPVGSSWGFSSGPMTENLSANAGDIRDAGLIPGLGRSPGGGHGNPFQYSCLEKPMDRAACRLQSMGLQESGMTGSDLAITHAKEVLGQGDEIEKERRIILLPSSSLYL